MVEEVEREIDSGHYLFGIMGVIKAAGTPPEETYITNSANVVGMELSFFEKQKLLGTRWFVGFSEDFTAQIPTTLGGLFKLSGKIGEVMDFIEHMKLRRSDLFIYGEHELGATLNFTQYFQPVLEGFATGWVFIGEGNQDVAAPILDDFALGAA